MLSFRRAVGRERASGPITGPLLDEIRRRIDPRADPVVLGHPGRDDVLLLLGIQQVRTGRLGKRGLLLLGQVLLLLLLQELQLGGARGRSLRLLRSEQLLKGKKKQVF